MTLKYWRHDADYGEKSIWVESTDWALNRKKKPATDELWQA